MKDDIKPWQQMFRQWVGDNVKISVQEMLAENIWNEVDGPDRLMFALLEEFNLWMERDGKICLEPCGERFEPIPTDYTIQGIAKEIAELYLEGPQDNQSLEEFKKPFQECIAILDKAIEQNNQEEP